MTASIEYNKPTDQFWQQYAELWRESSYKPIFQSPHILQFFANEVNDSIAVFSCYQDEKMVAAAIFEKHQNQYHFLSDLKNDHNFFVIHRDCSTKEIEEIFSSFFQVTKGDRWTLTLHNQPSWANYMDSFLRAGQNSGLFCQVGKTSVCPMLIEESPSALGAKLTKSKNNRYKMNRLKKEQEAVFETFEGDEELDLWMEQFFQNHIKRWKSTPTPSKYQDLTERQFVKNCIQAWMEDHALVRFSIRIGAERIAFVIGLLQQNALLYHSLTYDTSYEKYSPGKVLIVHLGRWMADHNLSELDFGYGNEPYKYRFANVDPDLNTIYISNRFNWPFILKSKIVKKIKDHPGLINYYREKIKPALKGS